MPGQRKGVGTKNGGEDKEMAGMHKGTKRKYKEKNTKIKSNRSRNLKIDKNIKTRKDIQDIT